MWSSRAARCFVLVSAVSVLVAACGGGASTKGGTSGKGNVLIGEVVGASGAYGEIGQNMINAGKLAVAKLNADGGILGRHVELQYYDDQGNPTLGAQLFQRLVSAGAVVIVGSGDTGPATAAEAEKLHIPDIGIVDGGGPTVYPKGPGTSPLKWVFEYSTSTYELGAKLASYALGHCKATAMLHDQTSYGVGADQAVRYAFKQAGRPLALDDTISENWSTASTVDIAPEVRRVQASGADCVIPWLTPEDAARFVQTVSSLGVHFTVLANDAAYGDVTFPKLAGKAADGTISAELKALIAPSPALRQYRKDYQAQFHATPDIYGEQSYDAIMMFAQAAQTAHSLKPDDVRNAMENINNFQGITGTLGFSATKHESIGPASLVYIRYDAAKQTWVPLGS